MNEQKGGATGSGAGVREGRRGIRRGFLRSGLAATAILFGLQSVAAEPSTPRTSAPPSIFLGLHPSVDRRRIGALGICGYSGMSLTVSQQRWADAEKGSHAAGPHEVAFDEDGAIVKQQRVLPEALPQNPDPVLAMFFDYYRTPRGFHPRSINSTTAWTATTPMSFFSFPMYANIDMIAPRPILLIAGENAHSRYYSEDVYKIASEPRELLIVPGADHVDLYDRMDRIPFDKLSEFFEKSLR